MKTFYRSFLPEIFLNPISRNLIFIFLATLISAVILVTAFFVVFRQF